MKLHLPTRLRAAVLACFAVVTSFTTTLATGALTGGAFALAIVGSSALAEDPAYSGVVYTWKGSNGGTELAFAILEYDNGGTTSTISGQSGSWNDISGAIANTSSATRNTLRLAGDTPIAITYTFNPIAVAGFIVESGATGYSITPGSTSSYRNVMIGNTGSTVAYSTINEDFVINNSSRRDATISLLGTQNISIASGKTWTLQSGSSGKIVVDGTVTQNGGTMLFAASADGNAGSVAGSGSYTVASGELNLGGRTVSGGSFTTTGGIIKNGTFAAGGKLTIGTTPVNVGDVTFNGGTLDLSGATLSSTALLNTSGTVSFGNTSKIELGDVSALSVDTEYKILSEAADGWNALTIANFTQGGHTVARSEVEMTSTGFKFTSIGTNYTDMTPTGDFTWNYTDEVWNTEQDSSDASIAFAAGDSAVFSASVNVTMSGDGVTARNVLIQGNGTTVSMTGGAALTVEEMLTVDNGATLTLNTSTGSSGAIRGAVTVLSGGTLQFNAKDVTGYSSNTTHTININEGGRLVLNINENNETFRGTLNLDGSLEGTGLWDLYGGSAKIVTGDNKNAEISTGLRLRQSNSVISVGTGSTLTLKGTLSKNEGNGLVKNGAGKFVIEKALGDGVIGNVTVNGGTLELLGGGNLGTIEMRGGNTNLSFAGESKTYTTGAISTTSPDNYNRNITINEGITVTVAANDAGRSLANNYGMGTLRVDGVMTLSGELYMGTAANNSTTNNLITGTGVVNAASLTTGNIGTYNFSVNELNVSGYTSIASYANFLGGTTNLNGNSGYFNRTTIDGGTLNLVGAFRSNTNGAIYVNSGALNFKSTTTSPSDDPEQNFDNTIQVLHVAKGAAVTVDTGAVATIASATIAAPIVNKGSLTLSGTLTVSDVSGFTPTVSGGTPTYVDADGNTAADGYLSGERKYTLIANTGTLNDDAISEVSGVEGTYENGVLTVTSTDESVFYVNTAGDGVDAVALGEGKKYRINGGTLNVGTDAANILTTAVGDDGIIKLTTNATLGNEAATVAECKLAVSGATLTLGQGKAHVVDISSFSSMELDNATIAYHGANTTFNNVSVTANGANISIEDMKGDYGACDTMTLAGTTTLSENGTLAIKSTNWKYKVNIEALTGNGNISMASSSSHDNAAVLTIDSFSAEVNSVPTSFGGTITVTKNTGSATLNATIDSAVSSAGLNLVNGAVANMTIQTGGSWSGAVNVTGTGNALTSSAGGMNLSQLNVAENAALDLGGSVSALLMNQAGTVDIADMLLTDGAVLTYGDAANLLNVTDGMLTGNVVIGTGLTLTDSGVDLGLSSAIEQSKIGISNYTNGELLVVGDTWHLKSAAADPSTLVRYYWEGDDGDFFAYSSDPAWSQTDNDKSNLVMLPASLDNIVLVFSDAGTESNPNTMRLDGNKTVHSVEVSNGYYEFANAGKITCTELKLLSGGHLLLNKPMTVEQLSMAANSGLQINGVFTLNEGGDILVTGADAAIKLGNGRNLTADALDLSAADASLSLSGAGNADSANTATLNSISLGENSGLALKAGTSNLTVAASALSLGTNATITVESGQVLDLTAINYTGESGAFADLINASSGAGIIKAAASGSVVLRKDAQLQTNLEMAALELNSWRETNPGKKIDILANGSLDIESTLIIESKAAVNVMGGSLTAGQIKLGHTEGGNFGYLSLSSGSITTSGITRQNTGDTGSTFTMSGGTLDITGTAGIQTGIATTITGGTLKASGADGWGVTGASVGGAAVAADSTGKVTLTNSTITGNITGNDKLVLAGTVTTTTAATVSGATVGGLTLTTDDANALTLSGATLTAGINNAAGKLVLTGTTNVVSSGFTADESISWSASGNGYKTMKLIYQVANTTDNLDTSGVTWQLDGAATGFSYADGALTSDGTQDTTTYWVNSGTVAYADTDTTFNTATTIKLNGNSADGVDTLQLNTSLAAGLSIVATSGSSTIINLNGTTVEMDASQLGEGVSASTVTLTGSGKYSQAASDNALNLKVGGVTDSANWTGTVSVSGRINGLDADALGNTNSWVELKGVSGYPIQSDTINTNVRLTNNGNTSALNILNGFSDTTVTFAGQVSGSGDIMRGSYQGGAQTYVFSGDISGWNGSFKSGTATSTTVQFSGGSEVNAGVNQSGNTSHVIHVVLDDSSMTTPGTLQMNGDITASSLTVTEGTTAKLNGALSLTGVLTTNGVTQLPGDATNGVTLGQVAGTGTLEVLAGDLTLNKKSEFGALKMAADSTLKLDLAALGVSDLKNWSDAPMLTLGTLDTLATGGAMSLEALAGETLLNTLGDGDSAVLAIITDCKANLSMLLNNSSSQILEKDGFEYTYQLVKESNNAQVLITATRVAEGWIAEDTDSSTTTDTTWTDADTVGGDKWSGEDSIGKFFGYGDGTVNIEDDGVTTSSSVVVSAMTGTTDYTFDGGELNAASLAVNNGTLTINNEGVTTTGDAILANSGKLTVNADKELTVGGDMGVLDSATLENSGSVKVVGTLAVATTAKVTNAGTLDAGTWDAAGAAINNIGTLISGGGTIGSLSGEGTLNNSGVLTIESDITLGTLTNNGELTVGGKLTVSSDITTGGSVTVGTADLASATFDKLTSTGEVKATNLTVQDADLSSLNATSLTINGGTVTVDTDTTLTSLSNTGTLEVAGDLTLTNSVTDGGTVKADNVKVSGNAVFTTLTTDTLTADSLTVKDATITTLDSDKLTVTDKGTVAVTDDVTLSSLSGSGTLDVAGKVRLSAAVDSTVNVETSEMELATYGNSLGSLNTDAITMLEGSTLSTTDALLTVDGIEALSGDAIAISVGQTAFDTLSIETTGQYTVADYLLIDGAVSADMFSYTNEDQLQKILSTGMNAGLTVTDGVLSLSITEITNENGEVVGMIWDTTNGNTVANNGYIIDTADGFYKALDYVKQVVVTEDVTFDLAADSVGDSVAGNTSEPIAGLFIRNLSGGGSLTIKGNSAAQDVATLMNTPGREVSAVGLTADAATVNLGLPKGAEGYLESDPGSTGPMLKSLKLVNRATVNVNSNAEVLGDTDVADYARLSVKEGNILTTGMLSGTDEAEISGVIVVRKGGVYTGSYDEATLTLMADSGSDLRLRTGGRRSLSLRLNALGRVTLDSAGQDGSMDFLRVGESPMARAMSVGSATLNLLNTAVTDDGIRHSTITLTSDEGNYINKSVVTLSLGAAETARTLSTPGSPVVIDGPVDVTSSSIVVSMLGNGVKNGVLEVNTESDKNLTLARFVTGGNVEGNTVTLTGTPEMEALLRKYYTNARLDSKGNIKVDRVTDYYASRMQLSDNARVGIDMADAALVKLNPQANSSEYAELAGVLDSLDAAVATGNSQAADELGAAVSGASVAALGAAVAGDVERQLMGIRNRTTTMGVDQTQVNENMPYFNAWINAEGDFRRLDEDGTAAGYELSSWGGTVGFDVDMTPRLTMGLAATAMYGDFTAKSADHAEGDLDTYYVTAFARYAANRWSHTFVATAGMADTTLKRTVTHANGSYSTEGDAEAISFGFLYELGYVVAMNESATACLQPVFNVMLAHSSLDGYSEEGCDAALKMGDVDMTTVTFGMGARAQAIVGTNLYNRSSLVEGRALLKVRTGDTEAEAENALGAIPGAMGSVKAAEMGSIGAELGVGITVPMGATGGSIFADASLEVGSGYTNINGTVGYRINF